MLKPLLIMGEGMEARAARAHGIQEERLMGVYPLPADSLVPPEVDFDRLLASLKDLSELVVDGDTQVTPMPGEARLHDLEPIPLKLYRNGMMIFDGPFRSFHDPSTQVRVGGREDRPLVLPTLFIISWRWRGPVYPLWALSPMQNLQSSHPHLC